MRLRNVKGSRETIAANPLVIQNITEIKGHWLQKFQLESNLDLTTPHLCPLASTTYPSPIYTPT